MLKLVGIFIKKYTVYQPRSPPQTYPISTSFSFSMETLISARSSMVGVPFVPHLPSSSSGGFGLSCNFYPALAGKCPLRFAGGRASLSSRSDDQIGPLDSGAVDVIAIGSRKDAFIDFCLESPLVTSSGARFWYVLRNLSLALVQRKLSCSRFRLS